MTSQKEQEHSTQTSEVAKFYHGKTIFITGGAGFLGLVLLEALLRCCPGIHRIYLLLRPKKGVQPQDRKNIIFKKEIFQKIHEKYPDVINKVFVVSGDIALRNLGMSDDDLKTVTEEVSVVFHCAAEINFLKSLSYIIASNVVGTFNILELCRKLKKLDVLVYTSTAYSNCNIKVIDEKVYKMPFTASHILQLSRNDNGKELERLYNKCDPKFPNYYTFSKCIAENLLAESSSEFPISIVRPSIIICCMKGPVPGWIEYGSGIVSLAVGIGKGFIRVLRVDEDKITDQIPADIVANTHIIAGWRQALESLPSPSVYNCTGGEIIGYTWRQFVDALMEMTLKYPLPKIFQKPSITLCKSPVKYWTLSLVEHYIPAIVIDIVLWISGYKLRLLKLYKIYDKTMKAVYHFSLNEWIFKCENFKHLSEKLNEVDSELFHVNLYDFDLKEVAYTVQTGSPAYQRKDNKPIGEESKLTTLRYTLTSLIKWFVLGGMASVFYVAIF